MTKFTAIAIIKTAKGHTVEAKLPYTYNRQYLAAKNARRLADSMIAITRDLVKLERVSVYEGDKLVNCWTY